MGDGVTVAAYSAVMGLRWLGAHDGSGSSFTAMAGGFVVGQVVRYEVPPGWRGFVHGLPVTDPAVELEEARAAVEEAWRAEKAKCPTSTRRRSGEVGRSRS